MADVLFRELRQVIAVMIEAIVIKMMVVSIRVMTQLSKMAKFVMSSASIQVPTLKALTAINKGLSD